MPHIDKEKKMKEEIISTDSRIVVKIISEELWLNYFNNYLLKECVISECEYWKMFVMILQRTARRKKVLKILFKRPVPKCGTGLFCMYGQ